MGGDVQEKVEILPVALLEQQQNLVNSMPWGKWDPQYLPVGVCKLKQ